MFFIMMICYIMDNKNLNLFDLKLYNNNRKYECYLLSENNVKNLRRKAFITGVEFISGLIGSTCSFIITFYYTNKAVMEIRDNIFLTYLTYRISTDILMTSLAIWGSGRIMKEKPSFIKTTLGVLIFDGITSASCSIFYYILDRLQKDMPSGYTATLYTLFIILPPIGGVIGANLR